MSGKTRGKSKGGWSREKKRFLHLRGARQSIPILFFPTLTHRHLMYLKKSVSDMSAVFLLPLFSRTAAVRLNESPSSPSK